MICELQQCEMFSCILSNPEESALSIIDPLSISIDLLRNGTCELRFSSLNIRLSYNDVQIFTRILTSFGNKFKSSTVEILNEDIEHLLNIIKCKGWHCRRSLNNFKDQFDYFTKAVDWLNRRVVENSQNGTYILKCSVKSRLDSITIFLCIHKKFFSKVNFVMKFVPMFTLRLRKITRVFQSRKST